MRSESYFNVSTLQSPSTLESYKCKETYMIVCCSLYVSVSASADMFLIVLTNS